MCYTKHSVSTRNTHSGHCPWIQSVLVRLASSCCDSIQRSNIRVADQNKIRTAVSLRRVDPADIPATAKRTTESRAVNSAPGIPATAKRTTESRAITAPGRKRRREEYDVPNSQASSSVSGLSGPSAVQREQVLEEEDSDSVEPDEVNFYILTDFLFNGLMRHWMNSTSPRN